jgi:hypothetical protein
VRMSLASAASGDWSPGTGTSVRWSAHSRRSGLGVCAAASCSGRQHPQVHVGEAGTHENKHCFSAHGNPSVAMPGVAPKSARSAPP